MNLTQLARVYVNARPTTLALHHPFLLEAMVEANIDTGLRQAAFVAQVGLESGELRFMEEVWGPNAQQLRYDPPSTLAEKLGNMAEGDGYRFRGRGSIQLTGRANYTQAGKALGLPLLEEPELAASPRHAHRIAAWFWTRERLNGLADKGTPEAFARITSRINGAPIERILEKPETAHHDKRVAYWMAARKVLEC